MLVFPNGKINLGLRVTRKRPDGYHDIETVFFPVSLKEALEMLPQPSKDMEDELTITGMPVEGDTSSNLCLKAIRLLRKRFPTIPSMRVHLHKNIPTGAGLGGGSADGTFTLQLLNRMFNLNIPDADLVRYALELGSDCPFFIRNTPCIAYGRGEILESVALDLSAYTLVLVNPGIHVSTGKAFAGIHPAVPETPVSSIIQEPVGNWKYTLLNDFEKTVFKEYPEIAGIKAALYDAGAEYAAMSGTGSTVFGLFLHGVPEQKFPEHYRVISTALRTAR